MDFQKTKYFIAPIGTLLGVSLSGDFFIALLCFVMSATTSAFFYFTKDYED